MSSRLKFLFDFIGNFQLDVLNHTDQVAIAIALSESEVHPQVLAAFQDGIIEKCVHGRRLRSDDIDDLTVTVSAARKLANIHSTNVQGLDNQSPVAYFDALISRARIAAETFYIDYHKVDEECRPKAEAISAIDLKGELEWIKKSLPNYCRRVVLTHGDYYAPNFLLPTNYGHQIRHKLTIVNTQSSSFSYRGIDFGTYFLEKAFDYSEARKVPVIRDDWALDDEWERKFFIREYLREYKNSNPANFTKMLDDEELIYKESEFFVLMRLIWHFTITFETFPRRDHVAPEEWDLALVRKEMYFNRKAKLLADSNKQIKVDSVDVKDSVCCTIC